MRLHERADEASLKHARQLIDQGKPAEAITVFRSLQRKEGSSLRALNGLAIAHAELGRSDLAAEFFAKALALSPEDPATLNNIGYAALRRQETSLARRYLEMARESDERAPEINNNLDALKRLQARRQASTFAEAPISADIAGEKMMVQRMSETTVRLARHQPPSSDRTIKENVPPSQNAALIDFSELLDPWPLADHHADLSF